MWWLMCFVLLIFLLVEINDDDWGGKKMKVSYRFRSDTFVLQEIPVCLIVACVCVCVCVREAFLPFSRPYLRNLSKREDNERKGWPSKAMEAGGRVCWYRILPW